MVFLTRSNRPSPGQSVMEYLLLVAVVTAAIATMLPRIKRSTQSLIKSGADQIGAQEDSEQNFNVGDTYVVSSNTATRSTRSVDRADLNGTVRTRVDEATDTTTSMLTNMGWSEE